MTKSTKIIAALGVVAGIGVACALPAATHAADPTATTQITATVDETLSMTATPSVAGEIPVGGAITELKNGTESGKIIIISNNSKGYTVTAQATGAGGTALKSAEANTIAYGAPAVGTSAWGMYVTTPTTTESLFDLKTTQETLYTRDSVTPGVSDTITTAYKASVAADQAQGTYEGQVTFTAAINP